MKKSGEKDWNPRLASSQKITETLNEIFFFQINLCGGKKTNSQPKLLDKKFTPRDQGSLGPHLSCAAIKVKKNI